MNKKSALGLIAGSALLVLLAAGPALAQGVSSSVSGNLSTNGNWPNHFDGRKGMGTGVFGTVSAVSGNSITVNMMKPGENGASGTTTTYTVDATNAKVYISNALSTVANIKVGDKIMARGRVNGTAVTATEIRDGVNFGPGTGMHRGDDKGSQPNQNPLISGNGQPVVAGKVTAISGNSITITNQSNISYTIDGTNAKVVAKNNTSSVANIKVGDMLVVQGAINGNSVTASSIIDQVPPAQTQNNNPHPGFFGGIGAFFAHLFGF